METMLLKDTPEMQVILNKGILEKRFSVTVINKKTRKQRTYKNRRLIIDLIARCIKESDQNVQSISINDEEKDKIVRCRWDGDTHYYDVFESQEECDEEQKRLDKIEAEYKKQKADYLKNCKGE